MKTRVWIAMSLLSILAVTIASAQSSSITGRLNISFKFMAGKTEMPAGLYEVVKSGAEKMLLLRDVDSGKTTQLLVIERLSEVNPEAKHSPKVVFDQVGDQRYISEIWPADNGDGYLVGITKGEQKHVVVTKE